MPENSSRFTLFLMGLLLLGLHAGGALAGEDVIAYEDNKFTFGVGVGMVKFDSNVKVTTKANGKSRFIDLEGNLGLPEKDQVNTFYGAYRFNEKHSMVFGYFSIDRDSTIVNFSENYGDIVLIKANVSIEDNSRFYNIGYGYNLMRDDEAASRWWLV